MTRQVLFLSLFPMTMILSGCSKEETVSRPGHVLSASFSAAGEDGRGNEEPSGFRPETRALPAGTPVLPPGDLRVFSLGGGGTHGSMEIVPVEGMPFAEALRVCSATGSERVWEIQAGAKSTISLPRDDWILATFHVRAVGDLPDEEGAKVGFLFEVAREPWTKSIQVPLRLGKAWRKFTFPFRVHAGWGSTRKDLYEPGEMKLAFNVAYYRQCVEIGGIECVHYGRDVDMQSFPSSLVAYEGMEPDAAWRKAAEERIEKIRKGDLTVRVVDSRGKPVTGAKVRVRMTRHAFRFGTTVNAFYLLDDEDAEDHQRYEEEIAKLFNFAVLEASLKWPWWSRDATIATRAVDWLRGEGLDVRGHVLVWPRFYHSPWRNDPDETLYLEENPEELRKRITDHITNEVTTLRGRIVEWDVINEPYWNHEYMDLLGDEVMVEWYRTAHEADPSIPLFLNDNGILASEGEFNSPHQQHYEKTVRFLLENGAPLGGLGMQSHVKWLVTPPEKLLVILNRFAEFGLPIVVSEYDHDVADEEYQANYMRDFLTVIFSYQSVRGFLMWGFWDGKHWLGNAPIYRKDWSLKPSGEVYKDLVFREWWTDEEVETDRNGEANVRGFLGEYKVTVEGKEEVEEVTVGKGENVVVVEM